MLGIEDLEEQKMRLKSVLSLLLVLPVTSGFAEDAKTLASTLDVFVFPSDGQASDQQSKDEVECYDWAVTNTGSDPFELAKQSEQQQQQTEEQMQQAQSASQGAGVRGAAKGAAAGAVVGEIADDDAGKGAAYGAAGGAIVSRRRGRAASADAQQQVAAQGEAQQQAMAEDVEDFKKALSVCLEAKDYMVKF